MVSDKSLQQQINSLKKDNSEIKKKLATIEKTLNIPQKTRKAKKEGDIMPLGIIAIIVGAVSAFNESLVFGLFAIVVGIIIILVSVSKKALADEEVEEKVSVKPKKVIKEAPKPKKKPKETSFESDVGLKWFSRIGILALVVGIGLFIKYAIDNNWIDHLTRIILGVVFGICLIIFGELISRKKIYSKWGKTVSGGGFAISYFVIYAAYHFPIYREAIGISQTLDIILLSLIVLFAILFALKDDSQTMFGGAFFLGYITSLLSTNFATLTLIYTLILTIGLVIVVAIKKWPIMGLGGLIATYVAYLVWYTENEPSFWMPAIFLTTYFIAFTFQAFILSKEKELKELCIGMVIVNTIFFFGSQYFLFHKFYPDYEAVLTLILAIFYYFMYSISKHSDGFATTNFYFAILYLTLTIPIQLNKELVTIVWAVEALILSVLYVKIRMNALKISSYFVSGVAIAKTLTYDIVNLNGVDFSNILQSTRILSFIATIVSLYLIYYLFRKNRNLFTKDEVIVPSLYSYLAAFLLVIIVFLELVDHVKWISISLAIIVFIFTFLSGARIKEIRYQSYIISGALFLKVLFYDSFELQEFSFDSLLSSTRFIVFIISICLFYLIALYLENRKKLLSMPLVPALYSCAGTILTFVLIFLEMEEFWISVGWSCLALIILFVGFTSQRKQLRLQGIVIFGITILKVFTYDTRNLDTIYRTVSFIALGIILLLVSFVYTKNKDKIKDLI